MEVKNKIREAET